MRNKPFMEFVAKHGVDLPKAPAFRVVASEEVDHIVDRLTMKPSKRFPHFQYNKRDGGYNDWRTAHEEKIRRLRETLHMFGGGKETQPEEIEEEPKVTKTKKEKKRKKTYKEHVDDEIDTKKNGHLPGIN
ncbi:uncharacterized protein LOC127865487 [Dreissena polymorpha]|nr:uncharacterized protein LOC127865487 [Dreissena polymorpha]